jgi:hypothetical protein
MARADRYAFAVDDRAEIVRVYAIDDERQDACLVSGRADHARTGNLFEQAFRRALEQRVLVRAERREVDAFEIVDRGSEPDEAASNLYGSAL